MITPEITIPAFLSNPVDDLAIFLVGLSLRFFIKSDKAGVKLMVYLLPLILRYIKRYYHSENMKCQVERLEYEFALLKGCMKQHKQIKVG